MANAVVVTRIPSARVPVTEPDAAGNSVMSREWYRFFQRLFVIAGEGSDAATTVDLQLGPELAGVGEAIGALTAEVRGTEVYPPYTPQVPVNRYGAFNSVTTQTAAAINTAYSVAFAVQELSHGVTKDATNTKISVDRPGIYRVNFTVQLDKAAAGVANVYLWMAKNGTNITSSATQHAVQTATAETSVTRSLVLSLNTGDYLEVKWSTNDTNAALTTTAAGAPVPAIPSASINVSRIGDIQ